MYCTTQILLFYFIFFQNLGDSRPLAVDTKEVKYNPKYDDLFAPQVSVAIIHLHQVKSNFSYTDLNICKHEKPTVLPINLQFGFYKYSVNFF